jgi:ubiquinone/menaquinone biosynthesis C-methylase UbiE
MNFRSKIIEKGWDRYARWYDSIQPRVIRLLGFFGKLSFEEFQERVVDLANLQEGDKALDVACGTGASHPAILRKIGSRGTLIGTDISSEMVRRAKAKARGAGFKQAHYQKADVEELSAIFEKESFDAVISVNGLPQFLHPEKALREMAVVLKPGGRLAASTIDRDKCERNLLLWPIMKMAPRLWHKETFRRRLREVGLTRIRFVEEGLMLIIVAEKRGGRRRRLARADS